MLDELKRAYVQHLESQRGDHSEFHLWPTDITMRCLRKPFFRKKIAEGQIPETQVIPFPDDLLFKMAYGTASEPIMADIVRATYPLTLRSIKVRHGLWSGEVDAVTLDDDLTQTLWEFKTTSGYSAKMRKAICVECADEASRCPDPLHSHIPVGNLPYPSHVIQVAVYHTIWQKGSNPRCQIMYLADRELYLFSIGVDSQSIVVRDHGGEILYRLDNVVPSRMLEVETHLEAGTLPDIPGGYAPDSFPCRGCMYAGVCR